MRNLVHVGFDNYISVPHIIAVMQSGSKSVKDRLRTAKSDGLCTSLTRGRALKAVIVMENGSVYLSALAPETLAGRIAAMDAKLGKESVL